MDAIDVSLQPFRDTPYDVQLVFRGGLFFWQARIFISHLVASYPLVLRVGSSKTIHITDWNFFSTTFPTAVYIYEGSTGTLGTTHAGYNSDRESNFTPNLIIADYTPTVAGGLLEGNIAEAGIPLRLDLPELILKQNTDYEILLQNGGSDDIVNVSLTWYEETPDAYQKLVPTPMSLLVDPDLYQLYQMNVSPNTFYGYKFNGSSDYVQVTRTASIEPANQITLEFKVKLGALASAQANARMLHKWNSGALTGYEFFIDATGTFLTSALRLSSGTVNVNYNISAWDLNTIHHVARVYDGTNVTLYIDGVNVNSSNIPGKTILHSASDLYFAVFEAGGPLSDYFNGYLDEVRIWNIGRTQAQIQANMTGEIDASSSPGLVGYWKLNETGGSLALNGTNQSNNGTVHGTTKQTFSYHSSPGIINITAKSPSKIAPPYLFKGYKFNGTTQYINITDNAAFRPANFVTMECRMQLTVPLASQPNAFIFFLQRTALSQGYCMYIDRASNAMIVQVFIGAGTNAFVQYNNLSVNYDLTNWHHYAGQYDGDKVSLFIDGVNVATSGSFGAAAINYTAGTDLQIGTQVNNGRYLQGSISDVRIWSTARTTQQIYDNRFVQIDNPREPGLVGYWKLDENSGTSALDFTSNANTGSIVNGPIRQTVIFKELAEKIRLTIPVPTHVGP